MRDGSVRLQLVLRILGVLLVLGGLIWAGMRVDPEQLREWKETAHPVPFFLALALLPLAGVPTTPFFMVAGVTYGIPAGLMGTALALALNLLLSFLIAASGLRKLVTRMLSKTKYKLPDLGRDRGVRFTVAVRMVPAMPNFMKNYVLCVAGVPFRIYFPLSIVISMVYAAPFVVMGESIFDQDWRMLAVAGGLLALLAGGTHLVSIKYAEGSKSDPEA